MTPDKTQPRWLKSDKIHKPVRKKPTFSNNCRALISKRKLQAWNRGQQAD